MRGRSGIARLLAATVSAVLMLGVASTAATASRTRRHRQPGLMVAGVAQDPCRPLQALPVSPRLTGRFEPYSSILRTAGGLYLARRRPAPLTTAETACAAATERADRAWLRAGLVPGSTAAQRSMAARALLDLRLAVRPDGAVLAGWHAGWAYSWPRDASWVAVALAGTGHPAMAYRVLRFLQRTQAGDGIWAARYVPGGSGPVSDGRPAELDADGWVPWAVWCWANTQRAGRRGVSSQRCGRWSPGPPTRPSARCPATACPAPRWTTGRIRSRSRSAPLPRGSPACVPRPTWPRTSAARGPPATAAAGRPPRTGLPAQSPRRSAGPGISAPLPPGQARMPLSRSSGRRSRYRAPGCCGLPARRSGRSPSPAAGCGQARPGQARRTSPGPD